MHMWITHMAGQQKKKIFLLLPSYHLALLHSHLVFYFYVPSLRCIYFYLALFYDILFSCTLFSWISLLFQWGHICGADTTNARRPCRPTIVFVLLGYNACVSRVLNSHPGACQLPCCRLASAQQRKAQVRNVHVVYKAQVPIHTDNLGYVIDYTAYIQGMCMHECWIRIY